MSDTNTTDIKPGYKTTEFWLSLVAVVVGILLSSGAIASIPVAVKICSLIASILAALGYTASRASVKNAAVAAKK